MTQTLKLPPPTFPPSSFSIHNRPDEFLPPMAHTFPHLLELLGIPHPEALIGTAARQQVSVRVVGDACHPRLVPLQQRHLQLKELETGVTPSK